MSYYFTKTKRKCFSGKTWEDFTSKNYKRKRDCVTAFYAHYTLPLCTEGGSALVNMYVVKHGIAYQCKTF